MSSGMRDLERRTVEVSVTSHDLVAGTVFGGYEIVEKLGAGGMGEVYTAVQPLIGKRVAIKVLHDALSSNYEAVERFITEARAASEIGHPNIVNIFGFGEQGGRHFMVMELLIGENLRERILRSPMSVDEIRKIVGDVALALEAAHAKGIVHRDLKPDNIFLSTQGDAIHTTLLDFGIAKVITPGRENAVKTLHGAIVGTPAYMSPEQCAGQAVDERADIYALGTVLFEMLTRMPVFERENELVAIFHHVNTAPRRPSDLVAGIPKEIDELTLAMLDKSPDARPALGEVLSALRAPTAKPALTPAVVVRPRAWQRAAVILGMLGVAAFVAAVEVGRSPEPSAVEPGVGEPPVVTPAPTPLPSSTAVIPDAAVLLDAPIEVARPADMERTQRPSAHTSGGARGASRNVPPSTQPPTEPVPPVESPLPTAPPLPTETKKPADWMEPK
jgi:eukaryotic-like serine/threonine-protein kinase